MWILVKSHFPGARDLPDDDVEVSEYIAELDTIVMFVVDGVVTKERLHWAFEISGTIVEIFPALFQEEFEIRYEVKEHWLDSDSLLSCENNARNEKFIRFWH